MPTPRYPALFQVNTRVRLSELSAELGRKATLDDIPDAEVDRLAGELAAAPTRGLVRTREALQGSWTRSLAAQLDVERDFQRELGYTDDYAEGVAAFSGKRAPRFIGR